jgi:hypothetical protein
MNSTEADQIIKYQKTIQKKLLENPAGFQVEDEYLCIICERIIRNNLGWYDDNGPKCFTCQRAVAEKLVPEQVCKNRKSWLAMWELCQNGYHPMVIRKLIRKQELSPIIILDDENRPYFYIFQLRTNPVLDSVNSVIKNYNSIDT